MAKKSSSKKKGKIDKRFLDSVREQLTKKKNELSRGISAELQEMRETGSGDGNFADLEDVGGQAQESRIRTSRLSGLSHRSGKEGGGVCHATWLSSPTVKRPYQT